MKLISFNDYIMFPEACRIHNILSNVTVDEVSIVLTLTVKDKKSKDGDPGPVNFVLSST